MEPDKQEVSTPQLANTPQPNMYDIAHENPQVRAAQAWARHWAAVKVGVHARHNAVRKLIELHYDEYKVLLDKFRQEEKNKILTTMDKVQVDPTIDMNTSAPPQGHM